MICAVTGNSPLGWKSDTFWKVYEQSVVAADPMPLAHARPAEGHVAVPSVRSQVTFTGLATTVTVVLPIEALAVTFFQSPAFIHSHVGRPT